MSDYYKKRGELVATDDESITVNGQKYRISTSVRFKDYYEIYIGVLKIRSTTPHDTIDSKRYRVGSDNEGGVQEKVSEGVEWATERIERQEKAKSISIDVSAEVNYE